MGDNEVAINLEEAVRKIHEEKPQKRRDLLEEFASQPGDDVDRIIMSFMEDSSADVRRAVVGIMRRRGFEDREFYSHAAEDSSAMVKRTALAALKSLDRVRERQRTLSDHIFRRVGISGDRSREEGYFSRMIQSQDKNVRIDAIKRLMDVQAPWVPDLLLQALRDESWTNRTAAVDALAERQDLDIELLNERLHERLWYLRSTAVEILGRRKDPSAVGKMAHLVKDQNVEVRGALAESLGEIGGPECACLLEFLVADPNYSVRVTAEKALKSIRRHEQEK